MLSRKPPAAPIPSDEDARAVVSAKLPLQALFADILARLQTLAAYIRGMNRSPKKVAAARRNGRKGGRPRKKAA